MTNWTLMFLIIGEASLVFVAVAALMFADWSSPKPKPVTVRSYRRRM